MSRPVGVAVLVLITVIWGTTFVVIKESLDHVPPSLFLALRFTAAALVLVWVKPDRRALPWALALGLASFLSYGSQTLGLSYTTASKAAFITGLSVIITPFLSRLFLGSRLTGRVWLTAGVALAGLALMTLGGESGVNIGDLIIVITAFAYAVHLILISRAVQHQDPVKLAAMQLWPVAVMAWIWAWPHAGMVTSLPAGVWWAIIYLAVVATALVLVLQNMAQRIVPAHVAALIFVLEPFVAALFGWLLLGEQLGVAGWVGGAVVVAAMILSEAGQPRRTVS